MGFTFVFSLNGVDQPYPARDNKIRELTTTQREGYGHGGQKVPSAC